MTDLTEVQFSPNLANGTKSGSNKVLLTGADDSAVDLSSIHIEADMASYAILRDGAVVANNLLLSQVADKMKELSSQFGESATLTVGKVSSDGKIMLLE